MRVPIWILLMMTLLILAGCSTYSVVTDYDSSVSFGSYKALLWHNDNKATRQQRQRIL